jgi:regulator of protease activity HflC (stomatin/prohibitin superfamily)
MKIIERIVNTQTGETLDIERDLTAQELAEKEAAEAKMEAEQIAKAEAQAKRLALFEKLGITEEEAKILFS